MGTTGSNFLSASSSSFERESREKSYRITSYVQILSDFRDILVVMKTDKRERRKGGTEWKK